MTATMTCLRCGASCSSTDVAEVVRWDVSHDEVCPMIPGDLEEEDDA